jgi:hypothetical protein
MSDPLGCANGCLAACDKFDCPEEDICCAYSSVGCGVRLRRKDMAAHQADVTAHLSIFAMAEKEALNIQQQHQLCAQQQQISQQQQLLLKQEQCIIELQEKYETTPVAYTDLYNSCCCGKANAWQQLKDMSDGGDKTAQVYMMILYHRGTLHVTINLSLAQDLAVSLLPWLQTEAAAGNNTHAMLGLAKCYGQGTQVAMDPIEALKWYRLAAQKGNASAQYNLGCYYDQGKCVSADVTEALRWYRLAADQGLADAIYNVGCCYESGDGVEMDTCEALVWYSLAAGQGHAEAQYNVGCFHENGCGGVSKDVKEALKWYRLAAEQGHALVQLRLDTLE